MAPKRGPGRPRLARYARFTAVLWVSSLVLVGCTTGRSAQSTGSGESTSPTGISPPATTSGSAVPTGSDPVAVVVERPPDYVPVTIPAGGIVLAQLEDLIAVTERLRGQRFAEPPTVRFVLPQEVGRLRTVGLQIDQAAGVSEIDAALLELLGVFPERVDLAAFYEDFYSSAGAAFYDLEYRELIVPLGGMVLSPYEQWALVHELTHALMHQSFPATAAVFQEATNGLSDLPNALLGLIEGEAVLVQTLFFAELPPEERQAVIDEAARRANPSFRDAPEYFQTLARFPYGSGSDFVVDLFGRGGMAALDQAFATPPWTTEQVYHPDSYIALEPMAEVEIPAVRLPGYKVAVAGVWGELRWRALLAQFLNGARVAEAADGWGADRYEVLWNPSLAQLAFAAQIESDSVRDASEMAGALIVYIDAALGLERRLVSVEAGDWLGSGYAAIERRGSTVSLVIASDPSAGIRVAGQLGMVLPDFAPMTTGG